MTENDTTTNSGDASITTLHISDPPCNMSLSQHCIVNLNLKQIPLPVWEAVRALSLLPVWEAVRALSILPVWEAVRALASAQFGGRLYPPMEDGFLK